MRQTIQFDVAARRNGYIVIGLSIVPILVSIAIFAIGPFMMDDIDVEEEAIFTGRTGDVSVVENGRYSVFVVSDYTCEEAEVSIYEEDDEYVWEYFFGDCDDLFDELITLLEKSDSFNYTKILINNHFERAINHLSIFPNSNAKSLLENVAEYATTRKL